MIFCAIDIFSFYFSLHGEQAIKFDGCPKDQDGHQWFS